MTYWLFELFASHLLSMYTGETKWTFCDADDDADVNDDDNDDNNDNHLFFLLYVGHLVEYAITLLIQRKYVDMATETLACAWIGIQVSRRNGSIVTLCHDEATFICYVL